MLSIISFSGIFNWLLFLKNFECFKPFKSPRKRIAKQNVEISYVCVTWVERRTVFCPLVLMIRSIKYVQHPCPFALMIRSIKYVQYPNQSHAYIEIRCRSVQQYITLFVFFSPKRSVTLVSRGRAALSYYQKLLGRCAYAKTVLCIGCTLRTRTILLILVFILLLL